MSTISIVEALDRKSAAISSRKRSVGAASEENSSDLAAIVESTSDLVKISDAEYRSFRYINSAGRKMLGIDSEEDIERLHLKDYHPEWALERIRTEGLPAVLRVGEWTGETAFKSRHGLTTVVSQLITAQRAADGTIRSLSTVARDITESKRAQDALRRSEEMFRIITENATELIALVDRTGKRLYNSPSYQTVLGYSPEELRGTWSFEQTHPDDRAKILEAAEEAKRSGFGKSIEYRMRHKDGSWRTLESHAGVIRNARGEIENILIVARDVTERKRAEAERQRMELQSRHAQKMESIGQLAAGVAHEINTPIQYIGDNTRFLSDAFSDLSGALRKFQQLTEAAKMNAVTPKLLDAVEESIRDADLEYLHDEIPRAIHQALEGVERVAKIVAAMKDFSHPGTDEKTLIDLNRAIESTLTVAGNEWKYVAELVTELDPALPMAPCFPGEFNQVILNLVVNAAHAIAEANAGRPETKGTIRVTSKCLSGWAEVRISDSGNGIPDKARARIFEPFFTTKPVGKGTGQGLAIAHATIVEKHGGRITFETEIGKGTTFIIRLPISPITGAPAPLPD